MRKRLFAVSLVLMMLLSGAVNHGVMAEGPEPVVEQQLMNADDVNVDTQPESEDKGLPKNADESEMIIRDSSKKEVIDLESEGEDAKKSKAEEYIESDSDKQVESDATNASDSNAAKSEPMDNIEPETKSAIKEAGVTKMMTTQSTSYTDSQVSRLGKIRSADALIYKDPTNPSSGVRAGTANTGKTYYIHLERSIGDTVYYRLSTDEAGSQIKGWARASDMLSHSHKKVDQTPKTFYLKGSGTAASLPWGDVKDLVYLNLESQAGTVFQVDRTDQVSTALWHRGKLDGRTVWIHSAYLTDYSESEVSRLGKIRNSDAIIYKDPKSPSSGVRAGSGNVGKTYYIHREGQIGDTVYYRLSTDEAGNQIKGWVKAADMLSHAHKKVDQTPKTFYLKGTGTAASLPWGDVKDLVYLNLEKQAGKAFQVDRTDQVSTALWHRGTLDGQTVWIHSAYLMDYMENEISRLGKIRNADSIIYSDPKNPSSGVRAGSANIGKTYYIHREGQVGDTVYYRLSTDEAGSQIKGWVKASDLLSHAHKKVDQAAKTFYIKGTGTAASLPWGDVKDLVYLNLKAEAGKAFHVDRTDQVSTALWHRGKLEGRTVWIHSAFLMEYTEQPVSRLGKIRSDSTLIYSDPKDASSAVRAGTANTGKTYYIQLEGRADDTLYYRLSTDEAGSQIKGWVKASDILSHAHQKVDETPKTFYLKGSGTAASLPWGDVKDLVYLSLGSQAGKAFQVDRTDRVSTALWHRGKLDGRTVWIHSAYLTDYTENEVSRLGKIRNADALIYSDPTNPSSGARAGTANTGKTYYIHLERQAGGTVYYRLSTDEAGSQIKGWVEASDMLSHAHKKVDQTPKTFYLKGTGTAASLPWGDVKDLIYLNLEKQAGKAFQVDRTDQVSSALWHRGILDGRTVWIHSAYLTDYTENEVSRLGKIRSTDSIIYSDPTNPASGERAGTANTGKTYYIHLERQAGGTVYYRLSTDEAGSQIKGWVKAAEMLSHSYKKSDQISTTFYIKGTGTAASLPWGDVKDLVYLDLSGFKNRTFVVTQSAQVGNTTWYRGELGGQQVWVHPDYLTTQAVVYTPYNLSLEEMVSIQMKVNPQTDTRYKLWIREDALGSINQQKATVVGEYNWRLRRGPGTFYMEDGIVTPGTVLTIYEGVRGNDGYMWYHVKYTSGWVTANEEDVAYYLNPDNFKSSFSEQLQFLNLANPANIDPAEVNDRILNGKGILSGKAEVFVQAAERYGINEVYLISHALLETGNGTSELATGVQYNNRTVYNMYGIGAHDNCAVECGAKYAYEQGWFTPEDAIIGGAKFVGQNYIMAGQNTLYKMRWNPDFASVYKYASHQYATDIGWAYKQTFQMNRLYNLLTNYTLSFDYPDYR